MFVEICKPTLFTFGLPLYWFLSLNYRWVEYETGQYRSVDSNQSLVTGFMTTAELSGSSTMSSAVKYKSTEKRHKLITDAVIQFVVGCSLPLAIVENDNFRNLLHVLDQRFVDV